VNSKGGKKGGLQLYKLFKTKSRQLQANFARMKENSQKGSVLDNIDVGNMEDYDQEEEEDEQDINLTNQLIGEVQAFIFVIRWLIYEFYQFKQLKRDKLLRAQDYDALEDDMLYIIHKITVSKDVFKGLLVLTRIANRTEDKDLRDKYKQIGQFNSKYFPLENKPQNPF